MKRDTQPASRFTQSIMEEKKRIVRDPYDFFI